MYFTFKRNNQRTKKPVNRFLQDGASAGIGSLQTSILINSGKRHGMDFLERPHGLTVKTLKWK